MRRAGRLAAECLDMLTPHVVPGVVTDDLDTAGARVHPRPRRPARLPVLPRLLQDRLHLAQPRGLPRHSRRAAAARRRHRQYRRHRDRRRLARRHQPHVRRRRRRATRAKRLIDVTYEALERGLAAVKPGARTRRHRPRHPDLCREPALLGGARLLRPRRGPGVPRRAQRPALRPAGRRARCWSPACSSPSSRW